VDPFLEYPFVYWNYKQGTLSTQGELAAFFAFRENFSRFAKTLSGNIENL
jgi:hypothetical protein